MAYPIKKSNDVLISAKRAAALLNISIPTFWRRVADGTVPKPIKIGSLSKWTEAEIIAVIDAAKSRRSEN